GFIHTGHLVQPLVIDRAEDIVPAIEKAWDALGTSGDASIIARM
ncbi:MAG: hypothetical protein RIR97_928, partial [Pseudomonadota bacterium]